MRSQRGCKQSDACLLWLLLLHAQGPEKEARIAALVRHISDVCGKRGVMIKPFFDDAAQDDHSGGPPVTVLPPTLTLAPQGMSCHC